MEKINQPNDLPPVLVSEDQKREQMKSDPRVDSTGRSTPNIDAGENHVTPPTVSDTQPRNEAWYIAYLKEIAAAMELPPESVDLPDCQHVLTSHAKAITDALIVNQLENERVRRAVVALIDKAKDEGWYHYRGTEHVRSGFLAIQEALGI